jgi:site-specific recombinase XerD
MTTIAQAIAAYLDSVALSRSERTARTYRNALNAFAAVLADRGLPPDETAVTALNEDAIAWFAAAFKDYAPATERLYLTAVTGFYEYLAAEHLTEINVNRLRLLIRQRARRPGQRLPQFPREHIEKVLLYAENLSSQPADDPRERLRDLRDRAFLLTLADTGLRVHEACALRRGDVDWNEGRAIVIGKGNREAVVRFSGRALRALREYLSSRATLDGSAGRALTALPLFARHDKGAGKKIKPITTTTGRNIVNQRVQEALGAAAVGSITPHSFRHYFVTTVLRGSGGNLKLAQKLARHQNIAVTTRYAHLADDELDRGYYEIFNSDEP